MTQLKQRREIIFLYDVKDANPNGDPDNGNQPRMDPDGYNVVTDVRLKRTIRDYWIKNGKNVLVRRVEDEATSKLKTMKELITTGLNINESDKNRSDIRKKAPETFVDVKFFGAAITLPGANVSITGPVQFGIGRSLNKPNIVNYTITTTFAATENKGQGSFGETQGIDYSLIAFPGIISETTAKETGLSEEELSNLWDGLWYGTKNLNTRSKFNHNPRLLLVVVSKEEQFQIGGLNRKLNLKKLDSDQNILSESSIHIDVTKLINRILEFKDSISHIELKEDSSLKFVYNDGDPSSLANILQSKDITVSEL